MIMQKCLQIPATSSCSASLVQELRLQLQNEETRPTEAEDTSDRAAGTSPRQSCEKESEAVAEGESTGRKIEPTKLRYLKLKQKLASVCFKHEDVCMGKEAASSNKPRLMKLSIELERQASSQVHNYAQMEATVREIAKILEQRKDSDLHVLRQSKFIPSVMEFCKRMLSSYKNQYKEAMRVVEPALKVLLVFCTVPANREYLILTNRFQALASLLSWALSKKDEVCDGRFIAGLCSVLCYLLEHRFEGESNSILELSIEFVFCSQLPRRLRHALDNSITEEGISDQCMIKAILRLLACMIAKADQESELKPIYEDSTTPNTFCVSSFEWILPFIGQLLHSVLLDRDTSEYQTNLGTSQLSMVIYLIKIHNAACRLNLGIVQKVLGQDFLLKIRHLIELCKENYDKKNDYKDLLNQTILLIGYLCLDNSQIQTKIQQSKVLYDICNLPTKFVIQKRLVEVLMPTLCCVIHKHQSNMSAVFQQMSALHMKKFLKAEMQLNPSTVGHSRKLSLSSSTSALTQCSSVNFNLPFVHSTYSLKLRFPRSYWETLYDSLDKVE